MGKHLYGASGSAAYEDEKISLLIDYKTNIENDVNNKIILKLIQNKLNSLRKSATIFVVFALIVFF